MTGIAVLAGLTVVAMSIGLARNRLPWDVVRVGYVLGVATPCSPSSTRSGNSGTGGSAGPRSRSSPGSTSSSVSA